MLTLKGLVFAQTILFNVKLFSSMIYFKPVPTSVLQNVYDSDEISPEKNTNYFIILQNDYSEPKHKHDPTIDSKKVIQGHKMAEIARTVEVDSLDSSDEEIDAPYTDNKRIDASKIDDNEIDNSDLGISDLNLSNAQKSMLRKSWRSACDKKASRACTAACKSAYKIVCSSYKCRRRMKRGFKKECKRNCKTKFVGSVPNAESSE